MRYYILVAWITILVTNTDTASIATLLNKDEINLENQQCNELETVCYNLYYRSDLITWDTAFAQCMHLNQTLAVIPDVTAQEMLAQFSDLSLGGVAHPWVAGRRNTDDTWRDLNGDIFPYVITPTESSRNGSCVVASPVTRDFHPRPCRQDSPGNPNMIICQFESTLETCYSKYGVHISGVCYTNVQQLYDAPVWTWTGANQVCMTTFPGGTLAYKGIADGDAFMDIVEHYATQVSPGMEAWVGVQRFPWVWVRETSEEPMPYTNWFSNEGASVTERCLHIDLNERSKWGDKSCGAPNLYFVCQEATALHERSSTEADHPPTDSTVTTTTVTTFTTTGSPTKVTTRTIITPQPTTIDSVSPSGGSADPSVETTENTNTSAADDLGKRLSGSQDEQMSGVINKKVFIISVVCVSAALVLLVVIVAVWDWKRGKRKKGQIAEDIYFGTEDTSSMGADFHMAFCVENEVKNWRNTRVDQQRRSVDGDDDPDQNPGPSEPATNNDPETPTAMMGAESELVADSDVTLKADVTSDDSPGASSNASLIQSSKYSDVSFGRRLKFEHSPKTSMYDEITN